MTQISANSAIMERLGRMEAKIDLLLAKQPYKPTEEEQQAMQEDLDYLKSTVHLPVYDHLKPWVRRQPKSTVGP